MLITKGLFVAGCSLVASMGMISTASATPVTETLHYTIGHFLDAGGTVAPPLPTLSGSFTVTFDPTQNIGTTTSGLTVLSSSYPAIGSTLSYAWSPFYQVLSFGGASYGAGSIAGGTNDFVIQFNLSDLAKPRLSLCSDPGFICGNLQGNSSYTSSGYTLANYSSDFWLALAGTTTTAPVAEPGAPLLLASGLAALALAGHARRRASAAR